MPDDSSYIKCDSKQTSIWRSKPARLGERPWQAGNGGVRFSRRVVAARYGALTDLCYTLEMCTAFYARILIRLKRLFKKHPQPHMLYRSSYHQFLSSVSKPNPSKGWPFLSPAPSSYPRPFKHGRQKDSKTQINVINNHHRKW